MVENLARQLLAHAETLSEEPFAGHGTEWTQLGEKFARDAVCHLHLFLTIHPEALPNSAALIRGTASWEAWQQFGA